MAEQTDGFHGYHLEMNWFWSAGKHLLHFVFISTKFWTEEKSAGTDLQTELVLNIRAGPVTVQQAGEGGTNTKHQWKHGCYGFTVTLFQLNGPRNLPVTGPVEDSQRDWVPAEPEPAGPFALQLQFAAAFWTLVSVKFNLNDSVNS